MAKTIGFRLDETHLQALTAAAKERGTTPGDYARSLVVAALTNAGEQELMNEIAALRSDVAALGRAREAPRPKGGGTMAELSAAVQELQALSRRMEGRLKALSTRADLEEVRSDISVGVLAILRSCRSPAIADSEELARWDEDCREWVDKSLKG